MLSLDAILHSTTTTGTGNLTLASVSGHPTFAARFGSGSGARRLKYEIVDENYAPLEKGIGYMSDATTLVRSVPQWTVASGTLDNRPSAALSLAAGTKYVFCPAADDTAMQAGHSIQPHTGSRVVFITAMSNTGLTSNNLTAGRFVMCSAFLPIGGIFDAIGWRVATGQTNAKMRVALYALDENGWPGKIVLGGNEQAVATSSTDVYDVVGTPVRLAPGHYAVGFNCDTTNVAIGYATTGTQDFTFGSVLFTQPLREIYYSLSYGALPEPAGTSSLTGLTGAKPYFVLRQSGV